MRDKLLALIIDAKRTDPEVGSFTEWLVSYLLAHRVVVLPCEIGDAVYEDCIAENLKTGEMQELKKLFVGCVDKIIIDRDGIHVIDDEGDDIEQHGRYLGGKES